jgi:hypothetical protein
MTQLCLRVSYFVLKYLEFARGDVQNCEHETHLHLSV